MFIIIIIIMVVVVVGAYYRDLVTIRSLRQGQFYGAIVLRCLGLLRRRFRFQLGLLLL